MPETKTTAVQTMRTTTHPFARGWNARIGGETEYDNPYPEETKKHEAWGHGWESADQHLMEAVTHD